MSTGPKIVHKQFNSPIGLYSQHNIQETLNKHLKNLDNGTVGIDFSNPNTDKPGNLANSAVLRMLEEEERNRNGYPSRRKVVWPPTPESNGYHQQQNPASNAPQSPQQPEQQQPQTQYKAPSQQYQASAQQYQAPSQQYQAPSQQYQAPSQTYQPPSQQYPTSQQYQTPSQQYQSPSQLYLNPPQSATCEGKRQEATGLSKLIPFGPGVTASPTPQAPYRQGPLSPGAQPYKPPSSRWAPVSPTIPNQAYSQPTYPGSQPAYSPQQHSPLSEPAYQPRVYEPPPSTITLRPQQPVHQKPSPVFASQPATASYGGGVNMRGDQKWPPQSVKEAVEAENEARRQLARGPACRPRKVKKDYSSFFSQHALNNNYPGYRAPPGTQHYEDHSGRSSY